MYTLFRKSQFKNALPGGLGCRTMLLLLLSMTLLLSVVPMEAQAAAGSYSLKWTAADPAVNKAPYLPTYAKLTPGKLACPGIAGRYADPLKDAVAYASPFIPSNFDAVTSLTPQNMALGQIVPFEVQIQVSGSTSSENGIISFTATWDTHTTSQGNFGYDPAYMVYCAFVDNADPGTIDPGNNARVEGFTTTLANPGNPSKEQIQGTFQISGLDNGDNVIVEIWVVLKPTITSGVTGNVQSSLQSAQAGSTNIGGGQQTVPLLRVGEFLSAIADVSVTKTDSPDPVTQGETLTYELIVRNNSPETIANGIVVTDTLDPSTSFVSASGALYTTSGNTVTFNVGALSPGESLTLSIVTTVSGDAPTDIISGSDPVAGTAGPRPTTYDLCNDVSVTAITADPTPGNNIYYQPTNVLESPEYSYDLNISCQQIVLNVNSSSPDGTSLTAHWYTTGSVLIDENIDKDTKGNYTSIYTPTPPDPVVNGAWYVLITEYSGTTVIGEDRHDFTVDQDCAGAEFPVGPVVFMLVAGVMYLTMRRKMDGS